MSEHTTILLHKETKERLAALKEYGRESYDELINTLITVYEKVQRKGELGLETKKDIEIARKQLKEGKGITTKKLMAELGL